METIVMSEQVFARFENKMRLGWVSYIAHLISNGEGDNKEAQGKLVVIGSVVLILSKFFVHGFKLTEKSFSTFPQTYSYFVSNI